jgi:hypothetical protein
MHPPSQTPGFLESGWTSLKACFFSRRTLSNQHCQLPCGCRRNRMHAIARAACRTPEQFRVFLFVFRRMSRVYAYFSSDRSPLCRPKSPERTPLRLMRGDPVIVISGTLPHKSCGVQKVAVAYIHMTYAYRNQNKNWGSWHLSKLHFPG